MSSSATMACVGLTLGVRDPVSTITTKIKQTDENTEDAKEMLSDAEWGGMMQNGEWDAEPF